TLARAYASCAARGAAAVVVALRDLHANRYRYHYPYSNPREVLPLPGAFVGRDSGARLARLLEAGPVDGRLATTSRAGPATADNVLGWLPGASDQVVLVTSHLDSPFSGVTNDASGMAAVLAMARHFASKRPEERPLSLLFLAAGG